jgi:hypothetical protein
VHASRRRSRAGWIVAGALVVVIALAALWMLRPGVPPEPEVVVTQTPTPTQSPASTPTPSPAALPADTASYDVGTLPEVSVFAVIPALPVDDEPAAALTGALATPRGAGAPVFADPRGEPVAYLPSERRFDGTTVPVVERQEHWLKVLLVGRQAVPSGGDPGQVTGWLRAADVQVAASEVAVEVDISDRTIDIVRDGESERVATDFAWGTDATPTPTGRTFIMTTRVVPEFAYTRGHPLVYLAVQSPTLDGFGGADVAVTAFHYHDERSGAISNGCIRLDPAAISALAALPLGTPVHIRP